MPKIFIPLALFFAVSLLSACNPISYFMLYEYSSAEKPDDLADQRISELEKERGDRWRGEGSTYRSAEVQAYEKSRGIKASPEQMDPRPISTEELRARLEKQAEEREKQGRR